MEAGKGNVFYVSRNVASWSGVTTYEVKELSRKNCELVLDIDSQLKHAKATTPVIELGELMGRRNRILENAPGREVTAQVKLEVGQVLEQLPVTAEKPAGKAKIKA